MVSDEVEFRHHLVLRLWVCRVVNVRRIASSDGGEPAC